MTVEIHRSTSRRLTSFVLQSRSVRQMGAPCNSLCLFSTFWSFRTPLRRVRPPVTQLIGSQVTTNSSSLQERQPIWPRGIGDQRGFDWRTSGPAGWRSRASRGWSTCHPRSPRSTWASSGRSGPGVVPALTGEGRQPAPHPPDPRSFRCRAWPAPRTAAAGSWDRGAYARTRHLRLRAGATQPTQPAGLGVDG